MVKLKFDWKITLWKGLKESCYVIIAGLAVVYGNSPYYLAILPLIKMFENWLKNHNK